MAQPLEEPPAPYTPFQLFYMLQYTPYLSSTLRRPPCMPPYHISRHKSPLAHHLFSVVLNAYMQAYSAPRTIGHLRMAISLHSQITLSFVFLLFLCFDALPLFSPFPPATGVLTPFALTALEPLYRRLLTIANSKTLCRHAVYTASICSSSIRMPPHGRFSGCGSLGDEEVDTSMPPSSGNTATHLTPRMPSTRLLRLPCGAQIFN